MITDTLPTHLARSQISKLFLKGPKSRLFVSSHGRHLTAWEQSSLSPPLHYVPTEIDILGRSCDVERHGSLLKIALSRSLWNVLISGGSARLLRTLLVNYLAEREAEITNLPWTQIEIDTALARCRGGHRAWRNKKLVFSLSAVTDEEGHPLEKEDESGRRLCEYWETIFQARVEGPKHHQHEDILRYVQQAHDDFRCTIDKTEFADLLALKKDSAPGPDGIPHGAYRCAGGLGSQCLFNAYRALLEGGIVPEPFAESGTVFIPKTADIDDNGRIFRSPDALRPMTLRNCDCKTLTSALCRPPLEHHEMHTSFAEMHLIQADDGQHFYD